MTPEITPELLREMNVMRTYAKDFRRAASGESELLGDLFIFVTSPQGHEYWADRYWHDVPLTNEDREFLLAIADKLEEQP